MEELIGKGATDTENFKRPAFFYRSAREGMQDFLLNGSLTQRRDVLLPAFIGWSPREGSGVFDPVRSSNRSAQFYDLKADLTVDLNLLEKQLKGNDFYAVVLIHYFGRTDPQVDAVRRLCDAHGALLVEDLAHGFFSWLASGGSSNRGHLQLFSLHKLFPLGSGGAAFYHDPTLVDRQASTAPEFATELWSYDWEGISQVRRRNFTQMTTALQALPEHGEFFELLWPKLEEHDVPQTLPIRTLSDKRDAMYRELNSRGFGVVSLYHTLIDEVRREFGGLVGLSTQIINLPVHQDVDPGRLDDMVLAFRSSLHEG